MNLCSNNHEEVCFESRSCPVCDWMDELNRVKDDLVATVKEIDTLQDTIADLENQLAA